MTGSDFPRLQTPIPGPRSKALAAELHRYECPGITALSESFPVFWERAIGANVEDVDGNRYIDATGAFGVANIGHRNPCVVEAMRAQADRLLHGMGDVHPTEIKLRLARKLAEITPGDLQQVIFSCSGSEAVESALKTAMLYTGKPGVVAFHGAYHGLSYGALAATARADFRLPFWGQMGHHVLHIPYPDPYRPPFKGTAGSCADDVLACLAGLLDHPGTGVGPVGAVLVEPIQGRGGIVVPPPSFLRGLRRLCDDRGLLLIADEVYTGFGRTGAWFAVEGSGVVPDLICLGKAMAGGFPISACVGTLEAMAAWGESKGEAIHTGTFWGHPLGCAMALAALEEIEAQGLVERARALGDALSGRLWDLQSRHPLIGDVRGRGLMVGVELVKDRQTKAPASEAAWSVVEWALQRGVILLTEGSYGNVLSFTPPLTITEEQLSCCVDVVDVCLKEMGDRLWS